MRITMMLTSIWGCSSSCCRPRPLCSTSGVSLGQGPLPESSACFPTAAPYSARSLGNILKCVHSVCLCVTAPIDISQQPPPRPRSQSPEQWTWSRWRSCARGGPKGQLHAAIARVGCPALEPTPERSLSCQRPLTHACALSLPPTTSCSLWDNDIGAEGASALAAVLKETKISNLKCAAALSVRFCVSAH